MARRKKISLTVTLPAELIEYLEQKVASRDFASMAHGVELCILRFKEEEQGGRSE